MEIIPVLNFYRVKDVFKFAILADRAIVPVQAFAYQSEAV